MVDVPGALGAGRQFRSSFTEGRTYPARVFSGRVVNFNLDTYAVAVHLDNTESDLEDIQVGMPYFHYAGGEGFYSIPEVGAKCLVIYPSDGSDPYIAAFLAATESVPTTPEDEKLSEGGKSTEGATTMEMEDEEVGETDQVDIVSGDIPVSYRNGRPLPRPGDMFWRTRDGNGIELRRGGLVSIGSTGICKRLYIPINNLIHDFCQTYQLSTPGSSFACELYEQDSENTRNEVVFTAREYAEDANASISMRIGELDDDIMSINISRNGVNYRKGTVINESDLTLTFSKTGDYYLSCQNLEIEAEERSVVVYGKNTEEYGELEQTVDGDRDISFKDETKSGKTSEEKLDKKTINASDIGLGNGKRGVLVRADLFLPFFNGHVHPVTAAGATGPPTIVLTEQMIATIIVKGS